MTENEETLVRSARRGDRPAFEELVRRTSRVVFARLYLETGDVHRTEDLMQETFLAAFRSLGELSDPRLFRPWLLKVAQNVAVDGVRHDLRKKRAAPGREGVAMLTNLPGHEQQPSEYAEREEQRQQVLSILRSLPEEYRLPLTLRYLSGWDYETICDQLGLTNGSLRGFLQRGLKMLRAELEQTAILPLEGGERRSG